MANHGYGISLSQHSRTSKDESSEHSSQSLATLSKGTSHSVGGATTSPSIAKTKKLSPSPDYCILVGGSGGGDDTNHHQNLPVTKKPRGRPRGSKNKPKPPITISKEDDQALKPVIIEISAGSDVVEELIQFAQRREVGLTVLSGSGSVTNVTLQHAFSHAPSFTLHGTFTLLSLSGTYISSRFPSLPTSSSSPLPNPTSTIPWPGCSSFAICLAGAQGQVFGGVIAGKMLAASLVVVVATLYKNPMLHKLPNNEIDNIVVDLFSTDNGHQNANALKGGTNNNVMAVPASFNVISPRPLNCPVSSNVNATAMQWSHPSRLPNN